MSRPSVLSYGVEYATDRIAQWVGDIGRITLMYRDMFESLRERLPSGRLIVQQMGSIGVGSLGLVIVVSMFAGAVAAVQAAYQFTNVVPQKYLGAVVLRSVIIELGPVLTALVVGGRVGASIAAELGTMKVTEQIDALRAMGVNPARYLILPRVIAATVMLPVITVFSDFIAVAGGFLVSVFTINVAPNIFLNALKEFFYTKDLFSGLIKAFFFGNIIGTMGCYFGFATRGGAQGVGESATKAVVSSCVMILIVDYVLATVLFRIIFLD